MKSFFSKFPVIVSAVIVLAAALIWIHTDPENHQTSPENTGIFELEPVGNGWWESRDTIYFDIPARVLFKIPETENPIDPKAAAEAAWAEFDRIGMIFNPYDSGSEIARLNAAGTTRPVPVSRDLFSVMQTAKKLWQASDGALDPTMFPIKQLWQKAVETQQVPSRRAIIGALSAVGFEKVHLLEERQAVRLDSDRIRFDFGGVAKGYAVDRVIGVLREKQIPAALVQLGGEIAAYGKNDGKPWRIGVQHPTEMNEIWGVVSGIEQIRVSTSGNYRQPIVISGHRFYHIFSPKTGMPVPEKILGVTATSRSGTVSNALLDGAATAISVLGADKGISFADRLDIGALILTDSAGGGIGETANRRFKQDYRR